MRCDLAHIATIQIEVSPLAIQPIVDGTLDQAMELGRAALAWSPLGGGRLGDASTSDPRDLAVRAALDAVAARIVPIVGSQQPAHGEPLP